MQLTIKKCNQCKKSICSKRSRCISCIEKRSIWRANNRQKEKDYQAKNWTKRAIVHSRIADRNKNRTYKQEDYITPSRLEFLQKLLKNKCVYCSTEMQSTHRRKPNGITIERINQKFPHVKNNVLLCCFRCNCVGGRGNPGYIIQQCFAELRNKHFNKQFLNKPIC